MPQSSQTAIQEGDRVAVTVEGQQATVIGLCKIGDHLDSVKVRFDKPFPATGEDEGWYGAEYIATRTEAGNTTPKETAKGNSMKPPLEIREARLNGLQLANTFHAGDIVNMLRNIGDDQAEAGREATATDYHAAAIIIERLLIETGNTTPKETAT